MGNPRIAPTQIIHRTSLSSNPHQRHLECKTYMHSHPLRRSSQCQSIPCTKQGGTGQQILSACHISHAYT